MLVSTKIAPRPMDDGHPCFCQKVRSSSSVILLFQIVIIDLFVSATYSYVPFFSKLQFTTNSIGSSFSRCTALERNEHSFPPPAKDQNSNGKVATFIIEHFDWQNTDDFNEVSNLCINVFFQEKAELERNSPMKNSYSHVARDAVNDFFLSFSLQHLKDLQQKDLSTRKQNLSKDEKNEMLIARQVFPCSTNGCIKARKGKDFVLSNETKIYNLVDKNLGKDNKYILGDIVGFVEVTSKAFALGQGADFTDTGKVKQRPVLSNLCVKKDLRGSGVGSSLLEACENAVTTWKPSYDEVILLVDEDNTNAIQFYDRRGYQAVFSDPASRRYETSGLFVRNVRSTKICMRKKLRMPESQPKEKVEYNFN